VLFELDFRERRTEPELPVPMLSVPFPYFPAFVKLVDDVAGDISLVVFAYKVNKYFFQSKDKDNAYTLCDFCLLGWHAFP
jgi:hypothetical protein